MDQSFINEITLEVKNRNIRLMKMIYIEYIDV